jgi:hypothetical protein
MAPQLVQQIADELRKVTGADYKREPRAAVDGAASPWFYEIQCF